MKNFKIKKIKSFKLFILFGLILTMFTACVFGFKSYAYAPNNEGDLINNNLLPCNNIEVEQFYIGSTQYGLKGHFELNSTNNIFRITYTADSRDLDGDGNISFWLHTPYLYNYDSENYLFQCFYDDSLNIGLFFGGSKSNVVSPSFADDYLSYNNMNLYYSNYLNYDGTISYLRINCYDSLDVGETYEWWFFLNVIPVSSLFNDYAFNPKYVDDIFDSHQDLIDLNNQLNLYISQNNALQSQVNNLQNQVNQLTNSNQVLLQQLANANNDYNLNNLVWSIGGTPFETFKTIWNFEFFGVNISNLIFGLLTGLIIIWIIKKFFF